MGTLKDPASHDELLNYQLKRLVTLGGAPAIRLCEGGYGVARAEWRLTAALVEHGTLSVGELAERARVDAPRVSRMLKIIIEKGLVQRLPAEGNDRIGRVAATDRGRTLYRELLPRLAEINRKLMAVLDDEEAALLQDFLARLTARAEAIHAEGGGVELKTGRYLGSSRRRTRLAGLLPPDAPETALPWGKGPTGN
jgi:DNA-binding MarR family transcriptional regulator